MNEPRTRGVGRRRPMDEKGGFANRAARAYAHANGGVARDPRERGQPAWTGVYSIQCVAAIAGGSMTSRSFARFSTAPANPVGAPEGDRPPSASSGEGE